MVTLNPLTPASTGHISAHNAERSEIELAKATLAEVKARLDVVAPAGPPVVLELSVTPGNGFLVLSWVAVDALNIVVRRDGVDAFGDQGDEITLPGNATSYKFENLLNGTPYTLTARVQPNGVNQTKTATPTAPAATPQTTVTTTVGDGTITVSWTPVAGATGYLVGRNGADAVTGGTGWQTTDPATATSRTFLSLVNGFQYTVFVEPQPSVANGGSFSRQTATATPVAAPPPAGQTVVTVPAASITGTTLTMNWTAVSGATGYRVGRVNLNNPADVFEITDPAGTLSRVFNNLTPGVPYSCYVTPLPNGVKKAVTATTTPPTTTTPTPPAGAGNQWLSGFSGTGELGFNNLASWRGEAVRYYRTWTVGSNPYFDPYANFPETLDIAVGGPGANGWPGWASAASGGCDAIWRTLCQNIHAKWGPNLKCVHLSMAHEINGGWYAWTSINNVANVRLAYQRWYNIVQQELKAKGRNVKVVLNYASGQNGVDAIYSGSYVDIIGVDQYDMYLPQPGGGQGNIDTQTKWDFFFNSKTGDGSPLGWGAWRDYAIAKGKPFVVPEWGLSPSADFEKDNPFWIQKCWEFFSSCAPVDPDNPGAGKIAGDGFFNVRGEYGDRNMLYPQTNKVLSEAKYRSLVWGGVP